MKNIVKYVALATLQAEETSFVAFKLRLLRHLIVCFTPYRHQRSIRIASVRLYSQLFLILTVTLTLRRHANLRYFLEDVIFESMNN